MSLHQPNRKINNNNEDNSTSNIWQEAPNGYVIWVEYCSVGRWNAVPAWITRCHSCRYKNLCLMEVLQQFTPCHPFLLSSPTIQSDVSRLKCYAKFWECMLWRTICSNAYCAMNHTQTSLKLAEYKVYEEVTRKKGSISWQTTQQTDRRTLLLLKIYQWHGADLSFVDHDIRDNNQQNQPVAIC